MCYIDYKGVAVRLLLRGSYSVSRLVKGNCREQLGSLSPNDSFDAVEAYREVDEKEPHLSFNMQLSYAPADLPILCPKPG